MERLTLVVDFLGVRGYQLFNSFKQGRFGMAISTVEALGIERAVRCLENVFSLIMYFILLYNIMEALSISSGI